MSRKFIFVLVLAIILSACAPVTATQTSEVSETSEVLPTSTSAPTSTPEPPTSTPTATPIPLPADVLAVLQDQKYTMTDTNGDGNKDIVAENGDTLFRYVPEADRIDGQEWQRMIAFTTTEGEKIEMPRFETFDEALLYISKHALWRTGDRMKAVDNWFATPGKYVFGHPVEIPSLDLLDARTSPSSGENFVLVSTWKLGSGTALLFEDENTNFQMIYVDYDSDILRKQVYSVPTPQP